MQELTKDIPKDYLLGLHWAATTGNLGLVKFALDNGAPIDAVVNGYMPLQLACVSDSNIAVVQYLIDRGANVNAQRWSKKHSADKSQAVAGASGSTALHMACARGCVKLVDLLLRNGASVDVKDKHGCRPLDIAESKRHVEIVRLLEMFGALQQQTSSAGPREPEPRRSMDTVAVASNEKAERFRRPSLPSALETKSHAGLKLPPVSTLPKSDPRAPRRSLNIPRSSEMSFTPSIDIRRRRTSRINTPELASSKSSDESTEEPAPLSPTDSTWEMPPERPDWYAYGVVNDYGDEDYLTSLERRAYGLSEGEVAGRRSLDQRTRPPIDSLKRCNSDGDYLRTAALMNAMASKGISPSEEQEPTPRSSIVLEDGPEAEALRHYHDKEIKKTRSIFGRKSMDTTTASFQYSRTGEPRRSLDIRPSLDSLSSLARRSMDGLSRKSLDINHGERPLVTDPYAPSRRPSLLTRLVDAWSRK